jgi:hypothetical protein
MSNSSTAATTAATGSLGRPAPTSFNASRTLGRAEPNNINPKNFPTRGRNASRSRSPYVPRRRPQEPKLSTTLASAQLMERARSSPSSQLLSSTMANPNGQATQNSVLQTLPQLAHQAPQIRELNNEFLLAYNSLIPNSEFARVHQQTTTGTGRGG